jgi:hypothetical protein
MTVAVEADVIELLRELVAEVKGLREDLAAVQRAAQPPITDRLSVLSRADLELLGRLLPPIGAVCDPPEFAVRELFEKDSAELRLVLRGLNGIRVGRLFQRAAGQVVNGYMVERAGAELHASLWRVVEVPGSRLPVVPPRPATSLP